MSGLALSSRYNLPEQALQATRMHVRTSLKEAKSWGFKFWVTAVLQLKPSTFSHLGNAPTNPGERYRLISQRENKS